VLGDAPARALLEDLWRIEQLPNVEFELAARQPSRGKVVMSDG
jgi:hypothetical protein